VLLFFLTSWTVSRGKTFSIDTWASCNFDQSFRVMSCTDWVTDITGEPSGTNVLRHWLKHNNFYPRWSLSSFSVPACTIGDVTMHLANLCCWRKQMFFETSNMISYISLWRYCFTKPAKSSSVATFVSKNGKVQSWILSCFWASVSCLVALIRICNFLCSVSYWYVVSDALELPTPTPQLWLAWFTFIKGRTVLALIVCFSYNLW